MDSFIKRMASTKHFKWVMFASKALIENFIETGSEDKPSKFDIGPVNTFISKNFVDGIRLRASARTTAKFNPHWFFEGYYAFGTRSRRNYYGAKVTYCLISPSISLLSSLSVPYLSNQQVMLSLHQTSI